METIIFETHYKDYCRQIAELYLPSIKHILGIEARDKNAVIPFFGEEHIASSEGISDNLGNRPDYMVCVILSKYLLLCNETPVVNNEWSALKDFHRLSQFTNLNVFTSDAERPIVERFSGRLDTLTDASQRLGGIPCELSASYDLAMKFKALPKINILLLFNDCDDEFLATCSILFQRQAEVSLDPELLIMVGIALIKRLKKLSDKKNSKGIILQITAYILFIRFAYLWLIGLQIVHNIILYRFFQRSKIQRTACFPESAHISLCKILIVVTDCWWHVNVIDLGLSSHC